MLKDPAFRRTSACSKWKKILAERNGCIPKYDVEVMTGSALTAASFTKHGGDVPVLVEEPPSTLGLRIPALSSLHDVAAVVGSDHPVKLIEVGSQQQVVGNNITLGNFADYLSGYSSAAHKVLNMITLEFSNTKLGPQVESPSYVRDCDWIDSVWPLDRRSRGDYPAVQKYCLSGMADSFTDFHVDFGGTSVFYHVIHGRKRFYLIPPTTQNLLAYAKWTTSSGGENVFFGDIVQTHSKPGHPQLFTLDLLPGQTLMIPGAWIHAVWTPEDSLVVGGNFLTSAKIVRQLQVAQVEQMTRVGKQYRFPYFKELNLYVLLRLLPLAHDGVAAAQVAGSFVDVDWEKIFEDEEDDLASAAVALLDSPILLQQLPYLVRQCEIWCSGGQLASAKADAARLASLAKSSIAEYTEKMQEIIESCADVFTHWWTLLLSDAELHDAKDTHGRNMVDHVLRIRASHPDRVDFLDSSFVCGGLKGLNSWPEPALLTASAEGTHQFGAPSSESKGQSQDEFTEREVEQEVQNVMPLDLPVLKEVNWVQCSSCEKWRTLPAYINADALPEDWTCSQNTWNPQHNACDILEEAVEGSDNAIQGTAEQEWISGIILRLPHTSTSQKLKTENISNNDNKGCVDSEDEDLFGDADSTPEKKPISEAEGVSSDFKLSISALKNAKSLQECSVSGNTDSNEDGDLKVRKKRKIHLTLAPKAKKVRSAAPDAYALRYEPLVANADEEDATMGRTRGKKLSKAFLQENVDVEVSGSDGDEDAARGSDNEGAEDRAPEFADNLDGRDMAYEEDEEGPDVTEADFEESESDSEEDLSSGSNSGYEDEEALSDDGMDVLHVDASDAADEKVSGTKTRKTKDLSAALNRGEDADIGDASRDDKAGVWKVTKFTGSGMSIPKSTSDRSSSGNSGSMPSLAALVGAKATKSTGNITTPIMQHNSKSLNSMGTQAAPTQVPATSRPLLNSQGARNAGKPAQRAPPSRAQLMKLMNKRR